MKVAISGSSGLIGSALVTRLRADGHQITRILRSNAGPDDVLWDPMKGTIDAEKLHGVDGVVHLAGAGIGDHRWSNAYKDQIRESRVMGTETLAHALASLSTPPSLFVSGSAIGFYGVRGDEELSEDASQGSGFLADVCAQWERATTTASDAGVRVAIIRTGVVLSAAGGALKKQLPLFRFGLGARLGNGTQQFSWITRRDVVSAIIYLLKQQTLSGPFNLCAPSPVSNAEFTKSLGHALHRPTFLLVPRQVLQLPYGAEMTREVLMASQHAVPNRLLDAGFHFLDSTLSDGITTALGDRSR